jgi:hypothetical protein
MNHTSGLALSVIAALAFILAIAFAPLLLKPRAVATPTMAAPASQVRSTK